jgi:DNA-binding NarL/FixJ family response regulator
MPEMDGFEVCRRLKDDPRSANIPIIFLSGLSASDDKLKAFEAGGVDYLVKPCSTTGLFVRLRTHLSLQNTQNRLTTEVRKRTMELEEKNHELRETNIVLKRLLHEIEEEKLKIGEVMRLNIERLILPDLDRMSQAPAEQSNQLRDTIRTNLLDITRPLAGENTGVYSALTPTELRVLNLIRQGQASKEIAAMLNIASQTVATHRKSIRKKLNISGKKINLVSFLNRSDRNHLI